MYKNKIKVLADFLIILIISLLFNNITSFAVETKEITIKYLDEDGNEIKSQEVKQIEMGEENITKCVASYGNIEGGTNIFPRSISEYEVQLCKIKTYYNGNIRDGFPDEGFEVGMETADRVAITSPKSSDAYIVEFIYKKSNTVSTTDNNNIGNWTENSNLENNEEKNSIKENEKTELLKTNDTIDESINTTNNNGTNTNTNINNSKTLNNTITNNQKLPKTGENNISKILIIISVIFFIVSIIKYNTYKEV